VDWLKMKALSSSSRTKKKDRKGRGKEEQITKGTERKQIIKWY
jgi:hypothetical protein